jgi:hypothetical protein
MNDRLSGRGSATVRLATLQGRVAAVIAVLLTFWSRSSAWIAAVIGRNVDHARALASAGRTAAIASRDMKTGTCTTGC